MPVTSETVGHSTQVGDITESEFVAIGPNATVAIERYIRGEQVNLNLDMADDPALFQELLTRAFVSALGLDKLSGDELVQQKPSENVKQRTKELEQFVEKGAEAGVPLTAKTAYSLGMMAAYRRDLESALSYFQQATELDPTMSEAYKAISWLEQSRAMSDFRNGDYDAATLRLDVAQSAAEAVDPQDARSLAMQGYCAKTRAQIAQAKGELETRVEQYELAGTFFRESLQLDADDAAAHNGLGNVYLSLEEYDQAIASCKHAIMLSPRYTFAYNDLAIGYYRKMQKKMDADKWCEWHDKARLAWEQTYDLAETDPGAGKDFRQQVKGYLHMLELDLRRHKLLYE